MILNQPVIRKIIEEVEGSAETDRRALIKRRHDIYKDGGKAFLVERILREFGQDALSEMRITPINLLKKIVDKRAGIYKRPPIRLATPVENQPLVNFYENEMSLNVLMAKANRYMCLASNTVVYIRPKDGKLSGCVVPAYQYSIVPQADDQTVVEAYIFSAFNNASQVTPQDAPYPATGVQSYSEQRYSKSQGDLVASNERQLDDSSTQYIFWTDQQHITTDSNGLPYKVDGMGEEQFENPINLKPVVNVARDRDNEPWATQGEDMVDLAIALQMGWTDVMTIAKHQGFSILTITSEQEPKKLSIGVNRAVWLKTNPGPGPQPSIGYVQGNSPLDAYKALLQELLALLLTTNNMEPGSIGGSAQSRNFTSGFHALIAMADSLEAVEADKPIMMKAEKEVWQVIAAWHNWMFDTGQLSDEARALGKFSEDFEIQVQFADVKPLESEDERINRVKTLIDLGLITKKDALKKLNPDLSEDQIDSKLEEIENESQSRFKKAQEMMGGSDAAQEGVQSEDDSQEPEDGDEGGEA